jgi:hypothetical protein
VHADTPWLLLIYTVPAEPSRKRGSIWREIKRGGAAYLRDGVRALPERPATTSVMRAIAAKVTQFEGQATLVQAARLDPARAGWVVEQARTARAGEYADIRREAERLLAHIAHDHEKVTLTRPVSDAPYGMGMGLSLSPTAARLVAG